MTADAGDRIADALADLADTLSGVRVLFEAESERYTKEREDDAEHQARRDPIRWESAVATLRDAMREAMQLANAEPNPANLADAMTAHLTDRLRSRWGLRDAFRTLGAVEPPEDLHAVARRKAEQALPDGDADWREAYERAWVAGALYHESG